MSKPQPVEKENSERWVISYADLVTLLLGFFIIMYASSKVDADKFKLFAFGLQNAFAVPVREGTPDGSPVFDGGRGLLPGPINTASIQQDLATIQHEVDQRAAAAGVGGQIVITRQDNTIVIRLPNQLLFPSASADLRPEALALLGVAGTVIAEAPYQVRVEGHTDNVPVGTERYPTNWELSSARATAVLRYLIEHAGVDAGRAFAAGFAEYRPVASNDTPEGRALNRRADIVLLYPDGSGPHAIATAPATTAPTTAPAADVTPGPGH
jgi:chemotaxis protein MotB